MKKQFFRPSVFGSRISSAAPTASIIFLVLVAALAGCAVGPDYKRPAVNEPTAYRTAASIAWKIRSTAHLSCA